MTLERAIEIIEAKRAVVANSHLRSFEEEPELEVLNGRYGPYIKYKGGNYRIPKERHADAASLSLEECMKFVEADGKKASKKSTKTSAKTSTKTSAKTTKSSVKTAKSASAAETIAKKTAKSPAKKTTTSRTKATTKE